MGKAYSEIEAISFNDGKIVLSIDWVGIFEDIVPKCHCGIFRVNISDMIDGKLVTEPIQGSRCFSTISSAKDKFNFMRADMAAKFGVWVCDENGNDVEVNDIDDFGEVEVPKDQPKTKSRNLGCW